MKKEGAETEEMLKREDILREIEDKEHHNLPMVNKSELHLEAKLPSEIASFQNQKMTDEIKREKPAEINFQPEQIPKKMLVSQDEAIKTMPKDIFKAKMGGTVSVP